MNISGISWSWAIGTRFSGTWKPESEALPAGYRAHGSQYESEVPLIIDNWSAPLPEPEYFQFNLHLTRFLLRGE